MFEQYKLFVGNSGPPNRFWAVQEAEIDSAETTIGMLFPGQLRRFFTEIGYGFYARGQKDNTPTHVNRILSPKAIANMVARPSTAGRPPEGFPKGAIPFFELGECAYLLLKPNSDSPNCVYSPDGHTVVSVDLQVFFEDLYNSAGFYRHRL